ncbi:hypothetical protein D5S18_11605 [Nocardia panacis]|uniref:Uncharacterized protein n=1 Tax=Nocardia panacis TaxID=2340916 RepID=A0A3A4KMS1_9NOCA|nr:hypothetical protein [Nocardia panacis]RJO76858.1 hypothetical protein D5S18_11605 [Nocardia panacis]
MNRSEGDALLTAGAQAYGRGEIAEALRIFEFVAATTEGNARIAAVVNAASVYDELGRHTEAIDRYRAALAEMPDSATELRAGALINMSQAQQHLGDLDGAYTALTLARALLADAEELGTLRTACLLSLTAVAMHRQQWEPALQMSTESLDAALCFAPHLAGHALMNMAGIHFETGRHDLADDFAAQALAAFEAAEDRNAVAETQQNLAIMRIRADRSDAEDYLLPSQEYFEHAGFGHRAGIGLKLLGFLAEGHADPHRARALYHRALTYFLETGAKLDAADIRIRLATLLFTAEPAYPPDDAVLPSGDASALTERIGSESKAPGSATSHDVASAPPPSGKESPSIDARTAREGDSPTSSQVDGEGNTAAEDLPGTVASQLNEASALLAAARHTFAELGLGLHCAQLDFWHAALLDSLGVWDRVVSVAAVDLAVPAALAIDAVRYTMPSGRQRDRWHREIADPALRLAFRLAHRCGDVELLTDLIATRCAGTTLHVDRTEHAASLRIPLDMVEPPPPRSSAPPLGSALAAVAAGAGFPVPPPPRLAIAPDGHIALAAYITAAEQRYGRAIRSDRTISA